VEAKRVFLGKGTGGLTAARTVRLHFISFRASTASLKVGKDDIRPRLFSTRTVSSTDDDDGSNRCQFPNPQEQLHLSFVSQQPLRALCAT
jgi:hypothetical protein